MAQPVTRKMNARFWIFLHGDFVKLTLAPGQAFEHVVAGRTEEGFCYQHECWEHVGDAIERSFYCRERDCDGLFERGGDLVCALDELAARKPYGTDDPAIRLPEWRDGIDVWQRDHAAEAAGY